MVVTRTHLLWRWAATVLFVAPVLLVGAWKGAPQPLSSSKAALVSALRSAGLNVVFAGKVDEPFLHVRGEGYIINKKARDTILVFEYPSGAVAARDAAKIGPDGSVRTMMIDWIAQPHFYRAGRVIIIYPGTNVRLLAALQRAVGKPFAVGPARR